MAYTLDYQNRWSDNPDISLRLAKHNAEQAIEKDSKSIGGSDLTPGTNVKGRAVIAGDETSTIVSANFHARIDRFGYGACSMRGSSM
jgi:hypothetical protein